MNIKGLDRAYETTKQIITLSTGIVALTVTFAKEFKGSPDGLDVTLPLKISWLLYCVAVILAVWTLLAITGTLDELDRNGTESNPTRSNIRLPAALMIAAFVGGIVTTIWSGFAIVN